MNKLDEHLNHIQEIEPLMILFSIVNLTIGATRLYKNFFTKAARRCSDLPEKEANICMIQAKIGGLEIKLRSLKNSLSKCNKTKDSAKCLDTIRTKIKKDEEMLRNLKEREKKLKVVLRQ